MRLLITEKFEGIYPGTEVNITADTFISMFPISVLHFQEKERLIGSLISGFTCTSKCFPIEKPRCADLEDPGSCPVLSFLSRAESTGGTEKNLEESKGFSEGPLLEYLHSQIRRMFYNSLEKNLLLTGIYSVLASYPKFDNDSTSLNGFLLDPSSESKPSCISTLKVLSQFMDSCVSKDSAFVILLEHIKIGLGILPEGLDVIKTKGMEVNFGTRAKQILEACAVLQEFLKELAGILTYKELANSIVLAGMD